MLAKIFRVNLDKRIDELGIDVDGFNKKDILSQKDWNPWLIPQGGSKLKKDKTNLP